MMIWPSSRYRRLLSVFCHLISTRFVPTPPAKKKMSLLLHEHIRCTAVEREKTPATVPNTVLLPFPAQVTRPRLPHFHDTRPIVNQPVFTSSAYGGRTSFYRPRSFIIITLSWFNWYRVFHIYVYYVYY